MMKNFQILLILMFIASDLKSQIVYPYFRLNDIANLNQKFALIENRESQNDPFTPFFKLERVFLTNCTPQKSIHSFRNFSTGLLNEDLRDSLIYQNGILKYSYGITSYSTTFNTFSRSKDLKTDTILSLEKVKATSAESYSRSILYRNQKGLDSALVNQSIVNGVWKNVNDYIEILYDSQWRVTKIRKLIITDNGFINNSNITYTYTNDKVTSKIDSGYTPVNNVSILRSIDKLVYTYNAKGVVSEVINGYGEIVSNQTPIVVSNSYRYRNTVFNKKDQVTVQYVDRWINGNWLEISRNETAYINDTFPVKMNDCVFSNNAWWQRARTTIEYCGVINSIKDAPTIDFKISPNPTQNIINITSSEIVDSNNKVMIFNSSGVQVLQKNDVTLPASVDLGYFSDGMYFLKFVNGKGVSEVKKFVVVR
jgi:Secretion system C-terminal sorting domain